MTSIFHVCPQIDVELLFSSDPFGGLDAPGNKASSSAASRFAFVKPRATAEVELNAAAEATTVTLADVLPHLGCAPHIVPSALPAHVSGRPCL